VTVSPAKVWAGQTVCCIASGPSLIAADVELVRAAGLKTIAVNNSWQLAPFCDVLYAGDHKWWAKYGRDAAIPAARWTCNQRAADEFGVHLHAARGPYNSGLRAIQLAALFGARRILLLGYDCAMLAGRKHWHPDHDGISNPTLSRMQAWAIQFTRVAAELKRNADVINCSRQTALKCFPRADLAAVLREAKPNEHQSGAARSAPDHPAEGNHAQG
jgi:hypothetical protein